MGKICIVGVEFAPILDGQSCEYGICCHVAHGAGFPQNSAKNFEMPNNPILHIRLQYGRFHPHLKGVLYL